jgi:hypothetical protein
MTDTTSFVEFVSAASTYAVVDIGSAGVIGKTNIAPNSTTNKRTIPIFPFVRTTFLNDFVCMMFSSSANNKKLPILKLL